VVPQFPGARIDEDYNLLRILSDGTKEILLLRPAFERHHNESGREYGAPTILTLVSRRLIPSRFGASGIVEWKVDTRRRKYLMIPIMRAAVVSVPSLRDTRAGLIVEGVKLELLVVLTGVQWSPSPLPTSATTKPPPGLPRAPPCTAVRRSPSHVWRPNP